MKIIYNPFILHIYYGLNIFICPLKTYRSCLLILLEYVICDPCGRYQKSTKIVIFKMESKINFFFIKKKRYEKIIYSNYFLLTI